MRAHFVVMPILLISCDDRSAAPVPSPAPSFSRDPATGETRARIAVGKGAAEMRSGAMVPIVLPAGFTIYPGATVLGNTRVERGGALRTLVEFETPKPIAKVLLFHRAQAQAAGASLTLDLDGTEAASIGGSTASGGRFALTARREPDRTVVEMSVSQPAASTGY